MSKIKKSKKILRIALIVFLLLTMLVIGLGIAAYHYVNTGAPTEEEINDRIAFLREKIRPKFPPEDDRRPLYEAFCKGIDLKLVDTACDNITTDITAENAGDFDAFCQDVDGLMESFKKVLKRPSYQFRQEYTVNSWIHYNTDSVMTSLSEYSDMLRLRAKIALANGNADRLIQCFRDLSEVGMDIACRGTLLQQMMGFTCCIRGQDTLSTFLDRRIFNETQLKNILDINSKVRARLVPHDEMFLEEELAALKLDDNTIHSWVDQFFLPGAKRAIINIYHAYRRNPGYIQGIKDDIARYAEEAGKYNMVAAQLCNQHIDPAFLLEPLYYKPRWKLDGLTLRAALAWHKLKHKAYPKTLNEIDRQILPDIPNDPCTDEPFIYKKVGDDYLLYSVGFDRVDDGGLEKPDNTDEFTGYDIVIHAPAEQH